MLILPAAVQAKLPTTTNTTIAVGKSIGGVALGMSTAKAKAAWGPGSNCTAQDFPEGATQCVWVAGTGASSRMNFTVVGGKVTAIAILSGTKGLATVKRYRTPKGIAIGATFAAVKRAYPKLGPRFGNPAASTSVLKTGTTETSFVFSGDKLDTIGINT
jgi:hypothetical protein